jgi:hypothetical protein
VLPSSCSIGALCSLGPGAEAEAEAEAVAGAAAAEEAAAVAEEAAAEVAMADSTSPFKKGSAIMKGAKNICLGVNLAMLTLWSGFDTGRV